MESIADSGSLLGSEGKSFKKSSIVKEFRFHLISELLPRLVNNDLDTGYPYKHIVTMNSLLKY